MIKSRASKFITDNNILYRNQFGFSPGCSTSDAILHFTDDCVTALDNRLSTIAIFLDFSKAFWYGKQRHYAGQIRQIRF